MAGLENGEIRQLVDLHTHTTHSDGTLLPTELISLASERGVSSLSITDHDTVAAYEDLENLKLAKRLGIELVPGVEISCLHAGSVSIHVLGLDIDPANKQLGTLLARMRQSRIDYAKEAAQALINNHWAVPDYLLEIDSIITKAHIADAVVNDPRNRESLLSRFGVIPARGAFIEAVMNKGGEAYIQRPSIGPKEAIAAIHAAGGGAFLAHPVSLIFEHKFTVGDVEKLIRMYDFDGLEALYGYYAKSQGDIFVDMSEEFQELAGKLGLVVTGGSDFHGNSGSIGNYMEIGYGDVLPSAPDHTNLQAIQAVARSHRSWS